MSRLKFRFGLSRPDLRPVCKLGHLKTILMPGFLFGERIKMVFLFGGWIPHWTSLGIIQMFC